MKKKTRTSIKSQPPVSIVADLIPETPVSTKKTNGTNGKHKEKPVSDGYHYDDLDSRELLRILSEMRNGNFAVRMPVDKLGIAGKFAIH